MASPFNLIFFKTKQNKTHLHSKGWAAAVDKIALYIQAVWWI